MKTYQQRLNIIIGQLQGVGKMIETGNEPCDVIFQMKASKQALKSLMSAYVQENFYECVETCGNERERETLIKKLLDHIT